MKLLRIENPTIIDNLVILVAIDIFSRFVGVAARETSPLFVTFSFIPSFQGSSHVMNTRQGQ
jgi:hypothetical protein